MRNVPSITLALGGLHQLAVVVYIRLAMGGFVDASAAGGGDKPAMGGEVQQELCYMKPRVV